MTGVKLEAPCLSAARVVEYDLPLLGHGWPALTGADHFAAATAIWRILSDARSQSSGPDL